MGERKIFDYFIKQAKIIKIILKHINHKDYKKDEIVLIGQ